MRLDNTFFKKLNALFVILGRLFVKSSFSKKVEAFGIYPSIILGIFLNNRVVSFATGGINQTNKYPTNPKMIINDNRVVRALGIFLFSKNETKGFKALITIKAIKKENISSLTIHNKFKKIKKRIVKTIVFADISILYVLSILQQNIPFQLSLSKSKNKDIQGFVSL